MQTSSAPSERALDVSEALSRNLATVRERVVSACSRAGRPAEEVRLLAVTKSVGPEIVTALADLGQVDIGENYVQAAAAKQDALARPELRWHLIGNLQRNKVRKVVGRFASVQTVDDAKIAARIGSVAREMGLVMPIFVQVNTSGEAAKSGCDPDALSALIDAVLDEAGVALQGLMTIGPAGHGPAESRPCFATLRVLAEATAQRVGSGPLRLSMGMSSDLEVAIEEGATDIRVGSALYEGTSR